MTGYEPCLALYLELCFSACAHIKRGVAQLLALRCSRIAILTCTFFPVLLNTGTAFSTTPWETYLSLPSPKNASLVTTIEYTPGVIPVGYGYWKPDLDILRNQMLGSDSEAFRLAYRLLQKADGGLSEDLLAILSNTIRARPEFFLKELLELRPSNDNLKSILLMLGTEYTDRPDAARYEMKMRLKALETVKAKTLKNFRDKCLTIIRKEYEQR